MTFRARLRFRVIKSLNSEELSQTLMIDGREVQISSAGAPEEKLKDAKWLVMNARGFDGAEQAKKFADKLKLAVQLSAVATRLGADCGADTATTGLGEWYRQQLLEKTGRIYRDNIHGIDLFEDDERVAFQIISITGQVLADPIPFLDGIQAFHPVMHNLSKNAQDVLLLLNFALMNTDPVAQTVLAISAVEMIGQQAKWSESQQKLIRELAQHASLAKGLPSGEAEEVSEAIRKSLHKISLRQGVMRLLDGIGLSDLKRQWDSIYSKRSTLVHGLAPVPGVRYDQLAFESISLCGKILIRVLEQEIAGVDQRSSQYYQL